MDWVGKNVLITGGNGFVGRHLARTLVKLQAKVTRLDNCSRSKACLIKNAPLFIEDASSTHVLARHMKDVDVVFNLAADVGGVHYNQLNNADIFARNIYLQVQPVLVASELQVPHFLQVSSVCIYPFDELTPADDESKTALYGKPTVANAGYAAAKRMGEAMIKWQGDKLPHAVIVRPSNIYGPGDYLDQKSHVIGAIFSKIMGQDEVISLMGSGRESREFLYVQDAVDGMIAAIERGLHGESYNLSTNGSTVVTIKELADMVRFVTGKLKPVVFNQPGNPGDKARWSTGEKALEHLGFRATTDLQTGLRKMYEWLSTGDNDNE